MQKKTCYDDEQKTNRRKIVKNPLYVASEEVMKKQDRHNT